MISGRPPFVAPDYEATLKLVLLDEPTPLRRLDNKLEKALEMGIDPFPATFKTTHECGELQEKYAHLENDERTEDTVIVAGRIMSSRNSGMFRDIRDGSEKIQIFTHKESATEESLSLGDVLDVGDFIGVEGPIRRTRTGELTVNAKHITLLTKSMLPLPEKFHGVKDAEVRQRNRSIDLIANDEARSVFRLRSQLIQKIREFMHDDGFLEIETPVLHKVYGAPRQNRSLRTTIPSMKTCICELPWSFT